MLKKTLELLVLTIILLAIIVLFFKDIIFSGEIFAFRDLGRFFYPPREFAFSLLKQGTIPFWNPYIFCGNPLLASHQAAVFYPASLVYLLGNFEHAFNLFIYLHIVLAGLFMYIFLRGQNLSIASSFIGSLTFAFSGAMLATINVLTFFSSSVWLPIVLWAYFRALEREALFYHLLTAAFLVFMFLAGEPMVCYMTSLILIFYGFKKPKAILTIFGLFILLSAFQLLPVLELLVRSDRMSIDYDVATKWSMAPYNFLNIIFPSISDIEYVLKDYWEKQSWLLDYYMGLFPIVILPLALVFVKNRKKNLIISVLAASVVLSLGRFTPVYQILFKFFPGFRLFRYPVKYFYLMTFSLAWLSALGLDFYENNAKADARLIKFVRIFLYTAFVLAFVLLFVDKFYGECVRYLDKSLFSNFEKLSKDGQDTLPFVNLSLFTLRRSLIFILAFIVLLFFGTKAAVKKPLASFGIAALVFIDLYSAAYNVNFSCKIEDFKRPSGNIEFLMQDKSLFRIILSPSSIYMMRHPTKETYDDFLKIAKERLYPNRMMEYGIFDVNGYEAATQNRIQDVITFLMAGVKSPEGLRLLDALNVKYIATPKALNIKGYRLVKSSDISNIYENLNVLPRAFLSEKSIILKGRYEISKKFQDKDWDPRKEVILEEEPESYIVHSTSYIEAKYDVRTTNDEKVEIIKYSPNEVVIKASVNSPKFLVLSDSYYPGWKAYVDGRRDKIYIANYILRAVYLDSGEHTVRFVFDPFSFKLGLGISLATLALILFYIVYIKK